MRIKYAGVANLGAEELAQTTAKVMTRARVRAEAEALFSNNGKARSTDQALLKRLFVQTSGAETMAPQLTTKTASVTANVDAFFDKLAESRLSSAQRRYPELLKASAAPGVGTRPVPNVTKRVTSAGNSSTVGDMPVRSSLAGGSA